MDQTPLLFALADTNGEEVWCATRLSGFDKRQCTVQLAVQKKQTVEELLRYFKLKYIAMEESDIRELGCTLLKAPTKASSDQILFGNICKTQHTDTENNDEKIQNQICCCSHWNDKLHTAIVCFLKNTHKETPP